MILRAAYRLHGDVHAIVRELDHEADQYDDAYAAAQAARAEGEDLLHVRRVDDGPR